MTKLIKQIEAFRVGRQERTKMYVTEPYEK